ncbi:MAG: Circadian clock protein KaiC [uncultured Thermomicrobiales bacterium]|uniref:non-specific serine/threonine protein kinase n=1 Tax=uncultured Thermomicrobiales bacterium TaxID=1645740 RepID=A0A6J4UBG7_9BACT|nr:MAG: Circadian clock protein KaiC [uncultured Thermomicrobiales bacterium]
MAQGEAVRDEVRQGGAAQGEAVGPERLATGIAGLDEIVQGGLIRRGIYLVGGRPGTGKTTLANHMAFNHAAAGGNAIFATVLAETHGRMLTHLSGFAFFDAEQVANRVHYVSIYDQLNQEGLRGVLDLLRRQVREHRATLLAIDGAGLFGEFAASPLEYRRFAYELHAQLGSLGCTVLLLMEYEAQDQNPIAAHVDGIIVLEDEHAGLRDTRILHVLKLRGSNYLRGRHSFEITGTGVEVYPRLEALLTDASTPHPPVRRDRKATGVAGLDDMLRGGVLVTSSTLVLGALGAGKTVTGLHFIVEGARRGERGLIVSFNEPPPRLIAKADAIGLDLGGHVANGTVKILWRPPQELLMDAWGRDLLAFVAEHEPRRLFLDAVTDLQRLASFADRLPAFLAALTAELRARDVTSLLAAEFNTLLGDDLDVPVPAVASTAENVVLLRYVELRSQLHRLISILKVRESDYDTSIREFLITPDGIDVAGSFESAEAVLTGVTRQVAARSGGQGARTRGQAAP